MTTHRFTTSLLMMPMIALYEMGLGTLVVGM